MFIHQLEGITFGDEQPDFYIYMDTYLDNYYCSWLGHVSEWEKKTGSKTTVIIWEKYGS